MKASKSFGGDYDCQQHWPEGTFLQCGEKGLVFSRDKEKPHYTTAFFEAFPKEPSTFLRGEGANLEEAELAAYKKFQRIIDCTGHEYKRRDNSEHGSCTKCGLFTSHCFAPVHSCSTCQKTEVNYEFNNSHYCQEHYIQMVEPLIQNYSIKDFTEYNDDIFSDKELNKLHVEFLLLLKLTLKYQILDSSADEYKNNTKIENYQSNFSKFIINKTSLLAKQINKNTENEKIKLTFINLAQITGSLFLNQELFESAFKEFFKISNNNYDDLFIQHIELIHNLTNSIE